MLLDLGNVTTYGFPSQGQAKFLLKKLAEHADIAAFLRDQSEPVRAQIDSNDVLDQFLHRQAAEPHPTRWKSSPVVAGQGLPESRCFPARLDRA